MSHGPTVRVGQGVDIHAFTSDPARRLVLGGVEIPGHVGLEGHSDADVVLHALTDAVLGAAAAGDLGDLVGVDRPETTGADSGGFVTLAMHRVGRAGFVVVNVDLTVIAQRPRISPHIPAMRAQVAELVGIDVTGVSVKATTTDRLGFIGRAEGIACLAIALLAVSDDGAA